MKAAFAAILLLIPLASAHLCLLEPEQRGNISQTALNTNGSDECKLVTGPCGAKRPGKPTPGEMFRAGANETVFFQKNLNHYYAKKPGNFTINLWSHDGKKVATLKTIPDTNTTDLYMYKTKVAMPKMNMQGAIQVIYYTNNPSAPPAFYQCADVMIGGPPHMEIEMPLGMEMPKKDDN